MKDLFDAEIEHHGALLTDTLTPLNACEFSAIVDSEIQLWGDPICHVAVAYKGMTYLWRIVDGVYDGSSVYVKEVPKSPWVFEEGKGWVRYR